MNARDDYRGGMARAPLTPEERLREEVDRLRGEVERLRPLAAIGQRVAERHDPPSPCSGGFWQGWHQALSDALAATTGEAS